MPARTSQSQRSQWFLQSFWTKLPAAEIGDAPPCIGTDENNDGTSEPASLRSEQLYQPLESGFKPGVLFRAMRHDAVIFIRGKRMSHLASHLSSSM